MSKPPDSFLVAPAGRSLDTVSGGTLLRLANALNIPIPAYLRKYMELWHLLDGDPDVLRFEVSELAKAIQAKVKALKTAGNFDHQVILSQDLLQRSSSRSQYSRIIDAAGAYYYSTDKLDLLNKYFNALQPGGMGLLWLESENKFSTFSKTVGLSEFLSEKWPKFFSRATYQAEGSFGETMTVTALIIKRPMSGELPPDLNDHLAVAHFEMGTLLNAEIPKVDYQLKPR